MKRTYHRRPSSKYSAFTLVELLVVMGIIAILASVLFTVGSGAIAAAKRAQATNLATQINTAILGYYTEYSVYPVPSTVTADTSYNTNDSGDWENLTYALAGNINPASPGSAVTPTVSNTRAISYLTLRKSDVDANGVPINPCFPSSKSAYFNVSMDADYNNIISNLPGTVIPLTYTNVIAGGSAVWGDCNTTTTSTNAAFIVKTF